MKPEVDKGKRWYFGSLVIVAFIINSFFSRNETSRAGDISPRPMSQHYRVEPAPEQKAPVVESAEHEDMEPRKAAANVAEERARYLARYLNSDFTPNTAMTTVALAAVGENGQFNHQLSAAIAARFKTGTVEIFSSLFKPQFVSDGLFDEAFENPPDIIRRLELADSLDVLLLARQHVEYSKDSSLEDVITAHVRLEIAVFPVVGQANYQNWSYKVNGAGFTRSEARLLAEERLLKQITNDDTLSFQN